MNTKRHYPDYLNCYFYRLGFTDGKNSFKDESDDILEQLHGKIDDNLLTLYLSQYICAYYMGQNMNNKVLIKKSKVD